ncbi:hypothetical protein AWM75_02560 [Aerococcus urinaehominis]|uniref:Uncharacterized protein n=1 Tax=Aerococcus urinaehominis TaxID=128944 RepID=A0A0X8FKV5_9LACT|nr:hypothetical protein [Aerococcus urinaehominis]AMB98944.1 hypothetical protein AWM75_02560 [Aerococcus urinaehominis]SDM40704.1 hypothetical protein SAMN04487985_11539 [Aerococcus urinaehominis]
MAKALSIEKLVEDMLTDKKIPYQKSELKGEQVAYSGGYQLTADQVLPFNIVVRPFQPGVRSTEAQITYRQLLQVKDPNLADQARQTINRLNQGPSAYYNVILTDTGEVFMRHLTRVAEDVESLYEILTFGSTIAREIAPILAKEINNQDMTVISR